MYLKNRWYSSGSNKLFNTCLCSLEFANSDLERTLKVVFYSPFISRFLAEDAGSRWGDQGGSSSNSTLGMCLHHGGYWLGGAECCADGASYIAISQNNPWTKHNMHHKQLTNTMLYFWRQYRFSVYQVWLQTAPVAAAAAAVWLLVSAVFLVWWLVQTCAGPALQSVLAGCPVQRLVLAGSLGCWFVLMGDQFDPLPSAACGSDGQWLPHLLQLGWAVLSSELEE